MGEQKPDNNNNKFREAVAETAMELEGMERSAEGGGGAASKEIEVRECREETG